MPEKNEADRIAMLARKWMEGTITEEEMAAFDQWYASFDDARPELITGETPEALRERLYGAILRRGFSEGTDTAPAEAHGSSAGKNRSGTRSRYFAAAACLAFLAFFSFWWMQNRFGAAPFTQVITIHAGKQLQKAILPDGTIIWLKPGAVLEYPGSFRNGRNVSLSGEALFEVAKDSLHAFTVSVGDYTATVLGTSFYIKQSGNRRDMELSVLTGKVSVRRKDGEMPSGAKVILPDQKLLTQDALAVIPLTSAESSDYVAGTSYNMDFRNTGFATVVARIERKFDVDIRGEMERYASCRFTADLTDEGLEYTLKLLAGSVGIDYRIEDKIIFFKGGGCR